MVISSKGYGQSPILFNVRTLYCGDGVIFPIEYKLPITIKDSTQRFTPSKEDIIKSEILLSGNADGVKYINLTGKYEPGKLKKKLRRYNRQYVGYKNGESDSIIVVNLMNFANKKQAKENFADWKTSYLVGFGEFYEKNRLTLSVNLTKKEVSMR